MIFWTVAAVLAGGLSALMMWRAARAAAISVSIDPATGVYQRQIEELDELTARGVLAEPDRRSAFAEAARRLLAVPPTAQPHAATPRWIAPGVAALTAVAALALYLVVGRPGLHDQPFVQRLAAWRQAPPQALTPNQMAAVLHELADEEPRNAELLVFLGKAELVAENPPEAAIALRRAVRAAPDNAEAQSLLGQALVASAQDESISPEAEAAFKRALAANPGDLSARYFLGAAAIGRGDTEAGLQAWTRLADDLPPDDPRRRVLAAKMAEVQGGQARTGADAQMIASMVDRLAQRLKTSPQDPEGWARLAHAYSVLGRTDARSKAIADARAILAKDPAALGRFEDALRVGR